MIRNMLTLKFLGKLKPLGPLALRAAVGLSFFAVHGMDKIRPKGELDWGQAFASSGHAPTILLYIAAWTEFLAGLGLLLGLLTRWSALGLLGVMGYAVLVIHGSDPYAKKELAIAYVAACIVLIGTGPGPLSLDRAFFGKQAVSE